MISDADHHRAKVRELAQGPPDEPTHCELKREFALTANTEKAELVKDVAAFANTPLEHHGGYGYLIFGVSQNGHIQGVPESLGGDPPSDIRNLLNRHLERQIGFDYVTTHVDAGGEKRKLAAIVIPNSRRKPHVISRELQEQNAKKTKFLLRRGEVWTRKAGGRQLATAEDIDAMYELRLLGAVRDATDPLERRIQALEGELVDLKSALLVLSFGAALPERREPGHEARVKPAIEALFTRERLNG